MSDSHATKCTSAFCPRPDRCKPHYGRWSIAGQEHRLRFCAKAVAELRKMGHDTPLIDLGPPPTAAKPRAPRRGKILAFPTPKPPTTEPT
jgi:hypothetical protein